MQNDIARSAGEFYSGTSGLVLPVPNKAAYPPAFRELPRLVYYSALFNSIEINSSFYKLPQAATLAKWAAMVPDDFRFTFKLWRDITHAKDLLFDSNDLRRFMQVIAAVGNKKGALLVQFPPGIRATHFVKLSDLLHRVRDAAPDWDVAVEFRHKSLYTEQTDQLLTALNMSMVIHDLPPSASPEDPLNAAFVYLRFHGPAGGYRGSYDETFLHEKALAVYDWTMEGKRVYAYFNNTMGAAAGNLQSLNSSYQSMI